MKLVSYFLFVLGTLYVDSVQSLKCQQGFNASIMGLPFYHWSEKQCMGKSDCFTQEVRIELPVYQLEAIGRYGGCVSNGYSQLLTCEKLFGEKSDLDPSTVFKMLPAVDGYIQGIIVDFLGSVEENFRHIFSNGTGPGSFVDGCYRLLSNLGLNVEKALPLRMYLVKFMEFASQNGYGWIPGGLQTPTRPTVEKFFQTLKNVTEEYKLVYPKSEFPEIVWNLAKYISSVSIGPPFYNCRSLYDVPTYYYNSTKINECYRKQDETIREFYTNTYNAGMSLSVDVPFAIFHEIDIANMDLYQEILKAFPDLQFIVTLMRLLDREDVKDLYKGFFDWHKYPAGRVFPAGFFEKMVWISNETVARITSKFGEFNKELRREFSPRSCKYYACNSDNCNTQQRLTNVKQVLMVRDSTKDKKEKDMPNTSQAKVNPTAKSNTLSTNTSMPTTEALKASTTTNHSTKTRASYLFNAIMIYMLRKLF